MKCYNKRKIRRIIVFMLCFVIIITVIAGYVSVRYVLAPYNREEKIGAGNIKLYSSDGIVLTGYEKLAYKEMHSWVILVHSYRTDHSFMNSYAKAYQEAGYNTLQPDNRAHGQSGGKYIGMGYLDQYDICCWIDYILERDPEAEIVLHGVSMGGAALMMLSGQEDLPDNVKVIIEDCGYKSARDYLTWKLKQRFHLPSLPVIPIANVAFKLSAGYYMNDASALEAVKKSNVPTLFIHGTEDQTVPVEDVYELYEAATCEKELYVVDGADHGAAVWIDEDEYWNRVFDFIDRMTENNNGGTHSAGTDSSVT